MPRAKEIVRRLVLATFGGAVAIGFASTLEASWARSASGATPPALAEAWLTCFGLASPVGVATGLAVGAAFTWLSPEQPPSPGAWVAHLRLLGEKRQADVAAFAPLAVVGAFVWMTGSAHLARSILSLAISAELAGLAIMTGALALGLLLAVATLAGVPPLRRALAILGEKRPACLDPALTGGTALLVVLALIVVGMNTGTVSGGGGFLGIFGIFKRAELDLRAPSEVLFVTIVALFAPSSAQPPRSPSWLSLALLGALSLSPLALIPRASATLGASTSLALAVERGAPLGKMVLPIARKSTDRDGDGASGRFGGGDCDDTNAAVHPAADEILDNGIDEDCSGADLTRRAVESFAPTPEAAAVDERLVPRDLNVVLITVDTLRSDLGYAGYSRPITPNIDALAAKSAVFDQAYSLASYTGKSIGPMMIGKYGSETDRNWGHFNKFGDKDTFLAERLKGAGIRTMGVHAHRYFDDFGGLERGFDVLDFAAAPPKNAPWDVDTRSTSAELTDAALAVLGRAENTDGRFFMWVHYLDPHADYLKHEGIDFGSTARDLYDGEVAFTDKHIGRLLAGIDAAPWGKRTAVIVTSDHGEAFGEHDMWRHGFEVWEVLVRVPLVVHVPGSKARHVGARRSLIDLVPTVLELMHVPPPAPPSSDTGAAAPTDFLSGQSLLVDVYLPDDKRHGERDILVDMPAGPYNEARRALIHDDKKLIVAGDTRLSLYDLSADPGEKQNMADLDGSPLAAMKERYAAIKARLREIKVTGKRK